MDDEDRNQSKFDGQGYLLDHTTWTRQVGELLAEELGLELTEEHWQLVEYAREVYCQTHKTPTRRKLVTELGVDPQDLFVLFPSSPMRKLCRVAGLPKPKNCL
ncbi:MAG TPA: TusE/DsrC/DsvC family sulfur relay protein [Anaerolineales bacterium]|nr:TusE/DsrC/DsvC family sulfur relay protein [Anaerolineales bacterium]